MNSTYFGVQEHPVTLPPELERIRERYAAIHVCVSPPRCCSTAFSRVFWEQPSVAYYAHEPFEVTHFRGAGLPDVVDKLVAPLDLRPIKRSAADSAANALVIKEMPYQVGENFPLLAALATTPLIFLQRDPRLSITSRMEKKMEVGDSPIFPLIESGWELLRAQIGYCQEANIPFLIVHAADFRNHPETVFEKVFSRLGLPFSAEMLAWNSCAEVEIDNLEGQHQHLYHEVLGSTELMPEVETIPSVDSFPLEGGFREHVERCLEISDELAQFPERIHP